MSIYLAAKEMWGLKGRFLLIAAVIALITTLVLFVAALGEGLGRGNVEYLDKLNADLIAYKAGVDLSLATSRLDRPTAQDIRRVPGVRAVGQISVSNASLAAVTSSRGVENASSIDISLIGVEPGKPGEPPVLQGRPLSDVSAREAIVDRTIALRTGAQVGDTVTIKSVQGTNEEFYELRVVGIADGRSLFVQPSIMVPHLTWERIRPGPVNLRQSQLVSNIVAVQLLEPANWQTMARTIQAQVPDTQVVDRVTAYRASPGYVEIQNTLDTQKYFALCIGVLVVGGFFQIQVLQKVPQIGVIKAIGASNRVIALTTLTQIVLVTLLGVALGTLMSFGFSLTFPPTFPISFSPGPILIAIASLLLIGPLGGLVSVRHALKVEPLTAIGAGK